MGFAKWQVAKDVINITIVGSFGQPASHVANIPPEVQNLREG